MIKIITLYTWTCTDLLLLKPRWPESLSTINNPWNKTKTTACRDDTEVERGLTWVGPAFINSGTTDTLNWIIICFRGLSCALSDAQQLPWPLPTRASLHIASCPHRQNQHRLRTTGLDNSCSTPNSVSQLPLRTWLSHPNLWAPSLSANE